MISLLYLLNWQAINEIDNLAMSEAELVAIDNHLDAPFTVTP